MGQIVKTQTFERDEDYGGGKIVQVVEYCSVSDMIKVKTDNKEIILPVFEWKKLFELMDIALSQKGHSIRK